MRLQYRLEGWLAHIALRLVCALGPVRASNLFGITARTIGPLLPVTRRADANLRMVMPELDEPGRRRVIRGMWENLGRTVGEFPHVGALRETAEGPGWEISGEEHVLALARQGGPAILFTGHIGNWEVLPPATAAKGVPFATIYRPSNNPIIDGIIVQLRRDALGGDSQLFAKGAHGARQALGHLRKGGYLGLLPDQKMNDGIEVRFFGRPAMTAPALAALAIRLQCPVLPTYARRIGPARFRVFFDPPLPLPCVADRAAGIADLTQRVNDHLEGWIRAWPEGWLWLHRRWPKP